MGRNRGKHDDNEYGTLKELKAANRRLKSDNERLKSELVSTASKVSNRRKFCESELR